jgi:CIC family chloride channel protein
VPASAGFGEIERAFLDHPVRYVYVVDEAKRFAGVVSLHEIKQRLLSPQGESPPTAGELMRSEFVVLTPETSLGDALQKFLDQGAERLPVVRSADDRRLLGVVSKSDLLLEIQDLTG